MKDLTAAVSCAVCGATSKTGVIARPDVATAPATTERATTNAM